MRAGTLRERLRIQRTTNYLGSWGQESVWNDFATVWANVKATGGAESFGDKGVNGSTTFLVRLRYRNGLSSQDRFIRNGIVLDVVSVLDPDGRRRELECVCVQHGNDESTA